jgi:maltooligosyltrehalose trehalohydrolase
VNVKSRTLGVNFDENGAASVLLWAPKAKLVDIFLTSSSLAVPLQNADYGYWELETELIKPGDQYFFIIDGGKYLPDPATLLQPEGVYGPSQAVDLGLFPWADDAWRNLNLQDYIIYELHTGTFTVDGTFSGIEEKLDYLVALGVTAIEIMPVAQFSGDRNWGYDGVFPYCVQNSYGGAESLQHLVNACHLRGLAVILDVVFNHIGPEGNHLGDFGHYFTEKYPTPWGNAINFDDAWCDGVREFFVENALMWFRDFHVDALRLDAVHAIKDFSPIHILREIRERVDALMAQTGRTHYLIVELDLNDTRFINPIEKGGFGMDAQWIDEFHHALRVSSGQERSGYYSDFDGISSLAKAYKDAYVYDGAYSEHRKKKFGMKASGNSGDQFVVFSQNHDQIGNRMLGERTSQLVSFEMQKLMAGAVMVSPYLPMIFMGEEYAESNPFLYFVSHTDPDLADAVRQGRKKEFEAFHLEGVAPDPMAVETFESSKLQWHLVQEQPHRNMLDYYKKLISLRKNQAAISKTGRENLTVELDVNRQILVVHRHYGTQHLVCMMNFSNREIEVETNNYAPVWYKLLASADKQWNGSHDLAERIFEKLSLVLPAESITVYTNQNE